MAYGYKEKSFLALSPTVLFVSSVFFTAPIGKALLPGLPGESLRFFFLILPFSFFYFLRYKSTLPIFVVWLAYVINALASIVLHLDDLPPGLSINTFPVVRLAVHSLIVAFFLFAAWHALSKGTEQVWRWVRLSFQGFLFVSVLGAILYIGVRFAGLPRAKYEMFNVLTQDGYGFLRFNPGSYPNEFGTMASFFSVAALALILRRDTNIGKKLLWSVFVLGFIGMALATTRAAYITFALGVIIAFVSLDAGRALKGAFGATVLSVIVIMLLPDSLVSSSLNVLQTGYSAAVNGTASVADRYEKWDTGIAYLESSPLLGIGFEFPGAWGLHNTYLQFLVGLGGFGFGVAVLIFLWASFLFRRRFLQFADRNVIDSNLLVVTVIAGMHASLFAASNHNQNHFLTWFALFLFWATGSLLLRRRPILARGAYRQRVRRAASQGESPELNPSAVKNGGASSHAIG